MEDKRKRLLSLSERPRTTVQPTTSGPDTPTGELKGHAAASVPLTWILAGTRNEGAQVCTPRLRAALFSVLPPQQVRVVEVTRVPLEE